MNKYPQTLAIALFGGVRMNYGGTYKSATRYVDRSAVLSGEHERIESAAADAHSHWHMALDAVPHDLSGKERRCEGRRHQ
jgi:hypothetical protein